MGKFALPQPINLSDSGPPRNANFFPDGKHESLQGNGSPEGRVLGYTGDEYLDLDTMDKWNKTGPTDPPRRATMYGWVIESGSEDSEILSTDSTTARSNADRWAETRNVLDFGADPTGVENSTAAFTLLMSVGTTRSIYIPAGTYRCNIVCDCMTSIIGESRNSVILKPYNLAQPVLTVVGSIAEGADENESQHGRYGNFTINCTNSAGSVVTGTVGMHIGGALGNDEDLGKCEFDHIYVELAGLDGIVLESGTTNSFNHVYVQDCGRYGWFIDNEANIQANVFTSCAARQCHTGMVAGSGNGFYFHNCTFESNRNCGIIFSRRYSSGPSHWLFDTCWMEGNGHTPTTVTTGSGDSAIPAIPYTSRGQVVFDAVSPTIVDGDGASLNALTLPANIVFRCCNFQGNQGVPSAINSASFDVVADRAQNVVFDRCKFTKPERGGYSSEKFSYNVDTNCVQIWLKQCGWINGLPTPTMYEDFPALTTNGEGTFGFFYEFHWKGVRYTNETNAIVLSGSYTPTHTLNSNLSASTVFPLHYSRVGNVVNVWGRVGADAIAATGTLLTISLPIASNLGGDGDLSGSGHSWATTLESAVMLADGDADAAKLLWTAVDVAARDWFINFSYRIIA